MSPTPRFMCVFEPSGQPMHLRHHVAICLAVFHRNVVYALELIHRTVSQHNDT